MGRTPLQGRAGRGGGRKGSWTRCTVSSGVLIPEPLRRPRRRRGPHRTPLQKAGGGKSGTEGLALCPSPPGPPRPVPWPRGRYTSPGSGRGARRLQSGRGGPGARPAGVPGRARTRANFARCLVTAWWVFFPATGGEPAAVVCQVLGHKQAGPGPPKPRARSLRGRRTEGRLVRGLGTVLRGGECWGCPGGAGH